LSVTLLTYVFLTNEYKSFNLDNQITNALYQRQKKQDKLERLSLTNLTFSEKATDLPSTFYSILAGDNHLVAPL
jgi:hypothetical protein